MPLWLNRDEIAGMVEEVRAMLVAKAGNEPDGERRLYLLSPVLFPIDPS